MVIIALDQILDHTVSITNYFKYKDNKSKRMKIEQPY